MITDEQRRQLTTFAAAVRASPHNLVSRSAMDELEERHIPESAGLAALLPSEPPQQRLIDVGSGGGFPGIVIAILRPDIQVTLLDGRRKKTEFLRGIAEELRLDVAVLRGRAEELILTEHGGAYDLATARAVAPMARLLPWTLPFLRPGGMLYAVKGERWSEELDDAQVVLRRLRGRVVATPSEIGSGTPNAPRTVIVMRAPS
ncbi:MAG: 16S rRNA (guanine(527)-N(7))-methyltransferase RsmG [Nitriliruptor sp.]|nr:MAG: 16S rRNA (guanine(527)-N(7))-methyltransferase RsmG [Nitriliruptor sp.]